jgi:hypothetical protein
MEAVPVGDPAMRITLDSKPRQQTDARPGLLGKAMTRVRGNGNDERVHSTQPRVSYGIRTAAAEKQPGKSGIVTPLAWSVSPGCLHTGYGMISTPIAQAYTSDLPWQVQPRSWPRKLSP